MIIIIFVIIIIIIIIIMILMVINIIIISTIIVNASTYIIELNRLKGKALRISRQPKDAQQGGFEEGRALPPNIIIIIFLFCPINHLITLASCCYIVTHYQLKVVQKAGGLANIVFSHAPEHFCAPGL